ncbi:protein roadkill-like [Saccostrea echinata]|uniref:protein roadkill-like n=1 Tax=Saccostrea echinata TaxID=191078 RepID=UPI002A838405|nr:protein roadkill-like [Saccostrea echinata]
MVILFCSAITCYNCVLVDNPLQCNFTTQCILNEVCSVTETIDDGFNFKYRLGCVNPNNCGAVVQKREGKRSLSLQCCARDNCNRGYPGLLTINFPATSTSPPISTTQPSTTRTQTVTTVTTSSSTTTATPSSKLTIVSTHHEAQHPTHHTSHHPHHQKHSTSTKMTATTVTKVPSLSTTIQPTIVYTDHTTRHHHHHHHNQNNDGTCSRENMVKHHNHFYYSSELHGRQRLTKQEAREACKMCHMELVSIHSVEELTFVHNVLANKNEIWLGMEHNTWTDGSSRNFNNWQHPEDANESCIVMDTNSRWQADNCYRTHLYVCKS